MNETSRLWWEDMRGKMNQYFSGDDVESLAFVLGVDYDSLQGGAKPTKINALLLEMGRRGQLALLLAQARKERGHVSWPDLPADFELPQAAAESGGATVYNIQSLNTGGGGFFGGAVSAGGDIQAGRKDVRGDEVKGNKYVMSGDFRNAILNIESRLDNVTQTLGAMPNAQPDQRAQLARLVGELKAALMNVPEASVADATTVVKRAETFVEEATAAAPDRDLVAELGASLTRSAGKVATAVP